MEVSIQQDFSKWYCIHCCAVTNGLTMGKMLNRQGLSLHISEPELSFLVFCFEILFVVTAHEGHG